MAPTPFTHDVARITASCPAVFGLLVFFPSYAGTKLTCSAPAAANHAGLLVVYLRESPKVLLKFLNSDLLVLDQGD